LGGTISGLNITSIIFTLPDSAGGNNNTLTLHTFIDNVTLTGKLVPDLVMNYVKVTSIETNPFYFTK